MRVQPNSLRAVERHVVLYDADCGFCTWSTAKLLAWDRHGRLRPLALQDPRADVLLGGMEPERKMASWHLVDPDGRVYSGGAAFAPLLRLLPGGRAAAALAEAAPRLTAAGYDAVAGRRTTFGRLVGPAARQRAAARIANRG
jgi:predicted DCC family thiol-disulfide oxidoreductase YuxK